MNFFHTNKQTNNNNKNTFLNFTSLPGLCLSPCLYSLFPVYLFLFFTEPPPTGSHCQHSTKLGFSQSHWWIPIRDFHGYFSVLCHLIYYHHLIYLKLWGNYTPWIFFFFLKTEFFHAPNCFLLVSQSQCLGLLGISLWVSFLCMLIPLVTFKCHLYVNASQLYTCNFFPLQSSFI